MRSSGFAAVLLCLAVLAACGTTPPRGTATHSPGSARPPAEQPTASQTPSGSMPTGTGDVEVQRPAGEPVLVKGVTFTKLPGLDRVVINLVGEVPGYSVRWVNALIQEGSGEPIDVQGGAYLQVTVRPANAHTDAGVPTWSGGPVFPARLGNLRSVVKTGDFEGVVGIGIVLDHRAPFSVYERTAPDRLVIDVAH